MNLAGQPAFPVPPPTLVPSTGPSDEDELIHGKPGLTIRQYAAIQAMQGLLGNPMIAAEGLKASTGYADDAVFYADSLIRKLEEGK